MAEGRNLNELKALRKKMDFMVVGDAAFHLYTGSDIATLEIVLKRTDSLRFFKEFEKRGSMFLARWNGGEVKVHVPGFHSLPIPPAELLKFGKRIDGFEVPIPEALSLIEFGRSDFEKIRELAQVEPLNFELLYQISSKYGLFETGKAIFNLLV